MVKYRNAFVKTNDSGMHNELDKFPRGQSLDSLHHVATLLLVQLVNTTIKMG